MEKKEWDKRAMTREEIEIEIQELEEQIIAWELEVKYEAKQNEFRDLYMEWYDERITLDEILEALMNSSICKRITVFPRD
jgi:hypothetical protein